MLLNFIPTWDNGKARVWMSHASEEITPLKTDVRGKIVPFFDRDNVQTEVRDVKHWLIMLKIYSVRVCCM